MNDIHSMYETNGTPKKRRPQRFRHCNVHEHRRSRARRKINRRIHCNHQRSRRHCTQYCDVNEVGHPNKYRFQWHPYQTKFPSVVENRHRDTSTRSKLQVERAGGGFTRVNLLHWLKDDNRATALTPRQEHIFPDILLFIIQLLGSSGAGAFLLNVLPAVRSHAQAI